MTNKPITVDNELLNAICNADLIIQKAFELKNAENNLRNQADEELKIAQEKKTKHQKDCVTIALVFTIPMIFGISLIASFLNFDILESLMQWGMAEHGFFTTWILLCIPVALAIFLIAKLIPCKAKKHITQADMLQAAANERHYELEKFIEYNKQYVTIIAPEFRYPVASKELVRIFQLGRASTLPEAYDKLELKLHQLKVEEGLERVINLQIAQIGTLFAQAEILQDINLKL